MTLEARNPRWNSIGTIDLEFNHPDLGWMPFTTHPTNGQFGPTLHQLALDGAFGEVEPYEPPEPTPEEKIAAARRQLAEDYRAAPPEDLLERLTALEIIAGVRDPEIPEDEEEEEEA